MSGPPLVRGLQERTAHALPASHVEDADGWWLRHSPGCAWWAGTVLPHGEAGPDELTRRVVRAERFYAGRGVVARFQISPRACPDGLDAFLADRGYRRESPMSLRAAATAQVLERLPRETSRPGEARGPEDAPRVRVEDRPEREWFAVWHAVHGGDSDAEWAMLARVGRPCAYAGATIDGDVVAVGRAVADTGWAGVFGMATLPEARGRGAARGVLAALAGWAATRQAGRMYLQVDHGNVAATRLYERAGFAELCGYHYRTGDGAATT